MRANKPPKGGSGPVARAVGSDGRRRGPNPVARRPQTKNGLGAQLAVQRPAGAPRPVRRCCSQVRVQPELRAALRVRRAARVPVSPSNAPPPDDDARALDWVNLQSTGQPKKSPIHPSRVPLNASLVAIELQQGLSGARLRLAERPGALRERRAHGGSGGSGDSTAAAEHETVTHTPPQLRRRAAQKAKACPPSPPRPTSYMSPSQ